MIGLIFVDTGNKSTEPLEQLEIAQDYAYRFEKILDMQCNHCESDIDTSNILNIQLDCGHSSDIALWYVDRMLIVSCAKCREVAGRFMIASRNND